MNAKTDTTNGHLAHLFDAELRYQEGLAPVVPRDGHAGDLVGSGTGRVAGTRLRGTLRWSNFEQSWPDHCQLTLEGEIVTEDGAVIRFDARGFALPTAGVGVWRVAAAVRFTVEDPRYRWLEPIPAIWEGEFDEATATARYRAYASAGPGGEGSEVALREAGATDVAARREE